MARSHAVDAALPRLKELCAILSEGTGTLFYAHLARSYRDLAQALEQGEVGLAWTPPIPAAQLEDKGIAAPLALASRRGGTSYHAALIVRRGGPKTIAELQGRRAVWVDRESA